MNGEGNFAAVLMSKSTPLDPKLGSTSGCVISFSSILSDNDSSSKACTIDDGGDDDVKEVGADKEVDLNTAAFVSSMMDGCGLGCLPVSTHKLII